MSFHLLASYIFVNDLMLSWWLTTPKSLIYDPRLHDCLIIYIIINLYIIIWTIIYTPTYKYIYSAIHYCVRSRHVCKLSLYLPLSRGNRADKTAVHIRKIQCVDTRTLLIRQFISNNILLLMVIKFSIFYNMYNDKISRYLLSLPI